MQIDYIYYIVYADWQSDEKGAVIVSPIPESIKIILFDQDLCRIINRKYNIVFIPGKESSTNPEIAEEIRQLLRRNGFYGIIDSNWHKLADKYFGRQKKIIKNAKKRNTICSS